MRFARDSRKAVERGDVREDLYYRPKVFDIAIAPLPERTPDIVPVGEALLHDIGNKERCGKSSVRHRDALEAKLAATSMQQLVREMSKSGPVRRRA